MIQKMSHQTEFPAVQFCRWQIFSSVKLWQEVCTCHVFHCCESGLYQTETFSEWASSQWFPANRWLFPTYTNFVNDRLEQTQYIFLSPWALLNTEQQKNTTVLEFDIKYKKYLECMFARNRNLNDNWTTATCKGKSLIHGVCSNIFQDDLVDENLAYIFLQNFFISASVFLTIWLLRIYFG